jgi:hypothetical protein
MQMELPSSAMGRLPESGEFTVESSPEELRIITETISETGMEEPPAPKQKPKTRRKPSSAGTTRSGKGQSRKPRTYREKAKKNPLKQT